MTQTDTPLNTPTPHSFEEIELLVGFVRRIPTFAALPEQSQNQLLKDLENYECDAQVVELLTWRIERGGPRGPHQFSDYLWLMRVQYLGLEKFEDFVKTAKQCIATLNLPFHVVRTQLVDGIIGSENFHDQNLFYKDVQDSFQEVAEKVHLLERLALIYEKKLFLENEVEPVFRKIIELDPLNVKALRFYKLWYVQAMRWKEAAEQLERLVEASGNPHEKQRAAHELAQLYLYNLNQPQQAKDILLEYCANSALDTRQTLLEALERLEMFDDLLEHLKAAESEVTERLELSAIKLKQGLVCIKAHRLPQAVFFLRESIALNPGYLHAYEALISAMIESQQSEEALKVVEELSAIVGLESSQRTLGNFLARAKNTIEQINVIQANIDDMLLNPAHGRQF